MRGNRAVLAVIALALALGQACFAPAAFADIYPSRPITLIVPYPAGGGVDVMSRIIGAKLTAALGQQVVIENRGGAGGMLGTREAARSAPDGYTIVMMLTGLGLSSNAGYDIVKDFAPIGIVAATPLIFVGSPDLPAKTIADVIAIAKKDPTKYSMGTPPAPTITYFGAKLLNQMANTDIIVVVYKGTGPLNNDLMGNHVSLGVSTIPASISQIASGKMKGIAVSGPARSRALPDIPTVDESGLPGFKIMQYYGMAAPAGTPRPIIERLNKELNKILSDEEFAKRLISEGSDPAPDTPEAYGENIKREEGRWTDMIKTLGLTVE